MPTTAYVVVEKVCAFSVVVDVFHGTAHPISVAVRDFAKGAAPNIHRLDGFYNVARSVMIHSEAHLDSFDEAFLSFFKGVEIESKKLKDELWDWLQQAKENMGELTDEQREFVENLDLDELRKLFEERLAEQDEQHDGGSKWIGTGGTSPFGHSGRALAVGVHT